MASKRLCIVTMIGPIDLIGELLIDEDDGRSMITLLRPSVVQGSAKQVTLYDMTRGGVISGDSIVINVRNILWIAEPSNELRSGYLANRPGIRVGSVQHGQVSHNPAMQ